MELNERHWYDHDHSYMSNNGWREFHIGDKAYDTKDMRLRLTSHRQSRFIP